MWINDWVTSKQLCELFLVLQVIFVTNLISLIAFSQGIILKYTLEIHL